MKIERTKKDPLLGFLKFIFGTMILIIFSNLKAMENPKTFLNGSIIAAKTGIMQFIIVPVKNKKNKKFHVETIKMLCSEKKTCFLNFFTNSKSVKLSFPLDDKILNEPTLMYRRSAKHQNATFQWSCRLNLAVTNCF